MSGQRPVCLTPRTISSIGIREWGLPTLLMPGKVWRSELRGTITITAPAPHGHVRLITRPLRAVKCLVGEWMPSPWYRWMARYLRKWPASASVQRRLIARRRAGVCRG